VSRGTANPEEAEGKARKRHLGAVFRLIG